mgnify:CR=1 FL=1
MKTLSSLFNRRFLLAATLVLATASAAAQDPQPELHIRGDKAVRYERVALAMAAAQRAGVRKIGFITEPVAP